MIGLCPATRTKLFECLYVRQGWPVLLMSTIRTGRRVPIFDICHKPVFMCWIELAWNPKRSLLRVHKGPFSRSLVFCLDRTTWVRSLSPHAR